jgi:hypothetical protein
MLHSDRPFNWSWIPDKDGEPPVTNALAYFDSLLVSKKTFIILTPHVNVITLFYLTTYKKTRVFFYGKLSQLGHMCLNRVRNFSI